MSLTLLLLFEFAVVWMSFFFFSIILSSLESLTVVYVLVNFLVLPEG